MRDYDIKFINKEITPFGGLSLFLKMLERCHFAEHLEMCSIPLGKTKDKHILYLARSLKTRQSFLSIWEKLKDFSQPYTDKS